jgi:hypothetical protein
MSLPWRTPGSTVWRVGRPPDPWRLPRWDSAALDGTFGNRFDDPDATYRVCYASSQRVCCFLETLARFRADLTLIAELNEIDGDDDYNPVGTVPLAWLKSRVIGSGHIEGRYAEIGVSHWIGLLRNRLARACLQMGVADLDAAALYQSAPRRLTQMVSREVYARAFDGIVYRSKYGVDLENWAVFEPFQVADAGVHEIGAVDPDFTAAMRLHRLQLA